MSGLAKNGAEQTLEVSLEGVLGRLEALLGLEPDQTELVLNVVDHDRLALTTLLIATLGGGVSTLQLKVLVGLLEVLAAVSLPEDGAVSGRLDVEGVGEDLVPGDDVL
jgi:hypothetical protein